MLREPEYWSEISNQDRNNNLLLSEIVGLIQQLEDGDIFIIGCGIEIGFRERMYHAQAGMFAIPLLNHKQLAKLHGMAFGIH